MNLRRVAAVLADTAPVLVLAAIAGAGSFTHIRDTAAEHGQGGPMAWAVAVCIDLTCVMAARERQRDQRLGDTSRLSWPALALAGGVLLSLAANLAQAQPTAWGRIAAATPPVVPPPSSSGSPAGSPPSTNGPTESRSPATASAPGSASPTSSPPPCSANSAPPEGKHHDLNHRHRPRPVHQRAPRPGPLPRRPLRPD